ncbi:hypothetical protein D0469_20460 [Peribacillus saganii]|uniref:Uncharacterized protein n=1 Tax=Peribacillus saganii TaxID=2303992 RepID=A0A372LAF3_9BACI|nr:hypothetical protein [Peribacillus saganii]RFU62617.1 hypothetical protein D0469_20460 [Peribacillus saganii]
MNDGKEGNLVSGQRTGNSLYSIAFGGLILTTVYTAVLASQLMSTKKKVDYLYYHAKFNKK